MLREGHIASVTPEPALMATCCMACDALVLFVGGEELHGAQPTLMATCCMACDALVLFVGGEELHGAQPT